MNGRDPINSALALESLRSQGFSTTSAICEIIDNSIEANATNIQIYFKWKDLEPGQKDPRVAEFTFVDNGDGMDEKLLYDCLVLGESTRRVQAKGIGKFGVGATFSGISQGRRIEVYSKPKNGQWLYTYLDHDRLNEGYGIPEPEKKTPPEYNVNHGTIVVWSKLDNNFAYKNLEELRNEMGRIYRKFITKKKIENGKLVKNNPITITVDNKDVIPYDPLFITYNRKKSDKDVPKHKSWAVPIGGGRNKSKIWITVSELPESWWKTEGAGNRRENTHERQIIDRNEGISVVREGREVLFGDIPYFKLKRAAKKKFIEVDRWTGIEVSFNRDADKLFEVQNNKSRLIISTYVRDIIAEEVVDTMQERRSKIERVRTKEKTKKEPQSSTSTRPGTTVIQGVTPLPSYTKKQEQTLKKVADKMSDDAREKNEIYSDLLKGYASVSTTELDPNGPFVRYEYEFNTMIVKYNMNHPFMKKFIETIDSIAKQLGKDPNNALAVKENRELKILFEILMASYGRAKKNLGDPEVEQPIEITFNSIISNWGNLSSMYTKRYQQNDS